MRVLVAQLTLLGLCLSPVSYSFSVSNLPQSHNLILRPSSSCSSCLRKPSAAIVCHNHGRTKTVSAFKDWMCCKGKDGDELDPDDRIVDRHSDKTRSGMDDLQPDEQVIEKWVEKLETSLESAVKNERYSEASTLRDELSRMHMDDTSAVLKTNSDFYSAFSSKNIELMGNVWHNSPHVQCIHPGAKPLLGYDNIVNMWRNMFQARDKAFKSTAITPSNVKVHVRGTSAFVTCTEEVSSPGAERRMLATNVFRKFGGRWYLVHHHASQASVRPASIEDLLQGNSGGARVIRIDGSSLREGDGHANADEIVDEIVRALQGALENADEANQSNNGEGSGMVGSMMFELSSDDDKDDNEMRRMRDDGRDLGDDVLNERELMDGVTERTVAALRKLAKEGQITREQKRVLLTDVVEHHQAGECASEVEIAYELLVARFCGPEEVGSVMEAELLEDFADQCKSLAKKLR